MSVELGVDIDLAHVWGGEGDRIYLAPLASTLPIKFGALDPAFESCGWLGEDGLTFNRDIEVKDFKVYQGGKTKRKKVTSSGRSLDFKLLEDSDVNDELADVILSREEDQDGIVTTEYDDSSRVAVRACVIDKFDDNIWDRLIIPRFEITVSGGEPWKVDDWAYRDAKGLIVGRYKRHRGPIPTAPVVP